MAKDKLTDYDSTASGNLDVGGISVAEGMLPSGVNNAIREQMSHLADFAAGTTGVDVLKLQDDTDTNSIKLQAPASVTTSTTFTLPDGDGASGQTMITDGAGTLSWAAPYGNRNLIINGAMTVAQRGTSETGVTSSRYANAPDRYKITVVSGGTWTASQTTTAPSGFSSSYKLECTATSTNTAMAVRLEHRFEGQNLQQLKKGTASAESVTLSFWVRSSTTGTYIANLTDLDNTRQISQSYTISAADTWEYKTLTFAGDASGVLDNDNGNSLRVEWWLAAGTDYTSGTLQTSWAARVDANQAVGQENLAATANNDFYITGIQLEVGDTATPFEHRSYGDELARCQRYYEVVTGANWYLTGLAASLEVFLPATWQVTKRATPTISNSYVTASGTVNSGGASVNGYYWGITANSSGQAGAWDSPEIIGDAEL
jgi:hypothetical protein